MDFKQAIFDHILNQVSKEMDKANLLHAIESKGQINTFGRTPEWVAAFEAYKKETKDYQVDPGCGTCYKKVLTWLRK